MKYKLILSFFLLLSITFKTLAQQELQVSHNMFNQLEVNPAYAGANGEVCATVIHRDQWMGFPGHPTTNIISLDAPVLKHFGAGINIVSDKLGLENNTIARLNLAYRHKLGDGNLGIGIAADFLNKVIDFSKFNPAQVPGEGTDKTLSSKSQEKNFMTDLTFGVFYKVPEKYYIGISTSQLLQTKTVLTPSTAAATKYDLMRHYYITGGYEFQLQSMPLKLVPSVFIKTDASSTQFDINCLGIWNEKYWGGLSYRLQDAISILIGGKPFTQGKMSPLSIGLAYDITTSAMRVASSGSLEIMLGYCFKISTPTKVESYRNVKYL